MSRWYAFLATDAALRATPPRNAIEWDAHNLPGILSFVLVKFHHPNDAKAWAALPGIVFLPRRQRPVPSNVATALANFGVVDGDTVDAALEKIAASWPHPGVWDHY